MRVEHGSDGAVVEVETPAGAYALEAEWFVDATGANSRIRDELGLEAHAVAPAPTAGASATSASRSRSPVERWTWIDAPFNEGRARLAAPDGRRASGASTTRWTSTPTRNRSAGPRSPARACASSSAPTSSSSSSGSARTSTATTCSTPSASAARSSSATPRTSSARSARAAATTASRTPPTSAGSWPSSLQGQRRRGAARQLPRTSATRPRSRTCASRAGRRASSRRAAPPSTACAAPSSRWRARTSSRAALANTGRMAQANAYPPSPWAPAGARSLQNVAVDGTTVMRLLGDGTRFLGLWLGAERRRRSRRSTRARWATAGRSTVHAARRRRRAGAPPRRRAGHLRPRSSRRLRRGADRRGDAGARSRRRCGRALALERDAHEDRRRTSPTPTASTRPGSPPTRASATPRAPTSTPAWCSCSPTRSATCRCCSTASPPRAPRAAEATNGAPAPARAARLHRRATRAFFFPSSPLRAACATVLSPRRSCREGRTIMWQQRLKAWFDSIRARLSRRGKRRRERRRSTSTKAATRRSPSRGRDRFDLRRAAVPITVGRDRRAVGASRWSRIRPCRASAAARSACASTTSPAPSASGTRAASSSLPGLQQMRVFSLRDQSWRAAQMSRADGPAPLQSVEGLSLGVDLTVRYALDPLKVAALAQDLPDNVGGEIVEPAVQGVIYKVFARYTVREIFSTKRAEIQAAVEAELKPKLAADGVVLRNVQIGKIDLPADYRRGMESLLAEELASEKMKYTLELKEKQVKETELDGAGGEGAARDRRRGRGARADHRRQGPGRGDEARAAVQAAPDRAAPARGRGREGDAHQGRRRQRAGAPHRGERRGRGAPEAGRRRGLPHGQGRQVERRADGPRRRAASRAIRC